MKKNYVMNRLVSLAMAVMLSSGALFTTALAAGENTPVLSGTAVSGTADVQDVFHYATGTVSNADTKITNFELTRDYIVCDVNSPTVTLSGNAVTVVDGGNQIFVVEPKSGENITVDALQGRIISTTTPIVRSITVSQANIEVGQTATLTGNVSLYNGTSGSTATYSWSGGSVSGQTTNIMTVNGSAVGAVTYTLTATAGGKSTSLPVTVTTSACPISSFTVTATPNTVDVVGGDKQITVTATPAQTGCKVASHKDAVSFDIDATSKGKGISISGNTITVPAAAVATGSTHNITVTANKDGKTGTQTVVVTNSPTCNAVLASITFTEPTATEIKLEGENTQTLNIMHSETYTGSCNDSTHNATNHHNKTQSASYAIKAGSPAGVTVNGSKQMVIAGTAPSGTITITASVTVNSVTSTAEKIIQFTRSPAPCKFVPTGFSYSASPSGNTINAESYQKVTLNPTVAWSSNTSCAMHPGDPLHGRTVTWSAVEKNGTALPAGVALNASGQNHEIVITKGSLAKPDTTIVVTAKLDGTSYVYTQEYKITRNAVCNKVITGMGKVDIVLPSSGASYNGGVLSVSAGTATIQAKANPITSGSCEYEKFNLTHTGSPHSIAWSVSPKARSTSANGIVIDSDKGVMTITRSQLAATDTTVNITASGNGNTALGELVVRRSNTTTGGGDSNRTEEQKNSEQWDKLEYRIEDADSKDTLSMSLGDNTNMPTRVLRELVGQNVTVELSVTGGYTWIINGKNIKKPPVYQIGIGLGVESVKNKDATSLAKGNAIKVLELEHEGSFYGTYTLQQRVDSDYEGKYLYLYKYDEDANKLYYRGSAKVDSDSYVKFPFTSASTYVMTDKALYGEKAGSTVGGSTGGGTASSSGGASVVAPPASSVAPPAPSSSTSSSSSSSSESSSEPSSEIELPSSSEVSQPTDTQPEEEPETKPEKKSIPLIVPILLVVVTITIVAVIFLAKGGMNIGG